MEQTVKIMVAIREETKHGTYQDNFYFDQDEYDKLGKDGVEKLAGERVANWVDRMDNPPPPYEPTKEDLQAMAAQIKEQQAAIEAKLTPLQSKAELQAALADVDAKKADLAAKIAQKG